MLPSKAACLLLQVASFFALASAANLAFYTPNFNAAPTTSNGLPYFVEDDFVTISWFTSFENTTLVVFQDLGNGTVLWELLAVAWPKSKTEQIWTAESIGNHSIAGNKFYFLLQNSNNPSCAACNLTSSHFTIKSRAALPTTTTTSHTTSSASTPTAKPTSHTTSSHSPPPVASSDVVAHSVRPKFPGDLNIELGVGLGAGIPAVLALIGIFFLWLRHRRDMRHKDDENKILPAEEQGPPREKGPMRERDSHLSRESGALGPYAQNPSPTWEQQEAREQAELQQQSNQRHRRGSSTRHVAFRPSLGAHSEASDEDSRHSWIDGFDFERPGYRDPDEMSQAQRSFRAAPGSSRSYHTPNEHSQSSIFDVADIPAVPQPVYPSYLDRNWPRR